MVVDWVKDFDDKLQLKKQCGRGPCILAYRKKNLRILCEYFEHHREVLLEGCVADPLQTITAVLPGSQWSVLLLRIVMLDSMSEVPEV